jgi:hypothetical protein
MDTEFGHTGIFHNLEQEERNMPAYQDPILAEVRKIRTEIAKKNNYDFHSYCKALRSKHSSMEKNGCKFKNLAVN